MSRGRWHTLAPVAFGIVGACWLLGLVYWISQLDEILLGDFTTYWVGARHLLAGEPLYPKWQLDNFYLLGFASNGRGYVYPPTSAVLTVPVGLMPLNVAWSVVTVASIAALAAAVATIGREHGLTPRISTALGLAFIASPPALESLATGNANTQVALGLLAVWLWPKIGGYLAILGGLVKLYPAVTVAWVIRKRAPLLGPLAAGAVLIAVSFAWLGIDSWRDFVTVTLHARPGSDFPIPSIRAGLGSVTSPGIADAVAYGVTLSLVLAVLRVRNDRLAFLALSLAMIAPAPDWYLHYMIVPLAGGVPLVAFVIARLTGGAPALRSSEAESGPVQGAGPALDVPQGP